jgi:hypothetical protein
MSVPAIAARRKLVLAGRLRTHTASDLALARLAALAPCLLARKKLGKDVRPTPVHKEPPIALASTPRAPVGRVRGCTREPACSGRGDAAFATLLFGAPPTFMAHGSPGFQPVVTPTRCETGAG